MKRRSLQLLASLAVVWALLHDADLAALGDNLRTASPAFLAMALVLKSISLVLHEVRLWLLLPSPRPATTKVIAIGLASGVFNQFLPARGGDVAAATMLHKLCGVRGGIAAAAVGLSAFLEAAVFGCGMVVVLLIGATRWEQALGAEVHVQALSWVTTATLGGIALAVIGAKIGQRLARDKAPEGVVGGLFHGTLQAVGDACSSPRELVIHVALTVVQVGSMVWAFSLALPAVGVDLGSTSLEILATGGVLTTASLASILLPPSYGAGPAAAAVATLAIFGVDPAQALAFSAMWWLISEIPHLGFGLPCLWMLRGDSGVAVSATAHPKGPAVT
jgi:uncharacterized protein (TIRG00374 family)